MLQISVKQDTTYRESWRVTPLKNTRKTMARNQY